MTTTDKTLDTSRRVYPKTARCRVCRRGGLEARYTTLSPRELKASVICLLCGASNDDRIYIDPQKPQEVSDNKLLPLGIPMVPWKSTP